MGFARCSGIPGRRARAAVLDAFHPRHIFTPLFIIFAAVCLVIAGCTDETVVDPVNGLDDPVCHDSLPYVEIVVPPSEAPAGYPQKITFTWQPAGDGMIAGTRYLITELEGEDDGIAILNDQPEFFEDLWSEWELLDPEHQTILIGEDEPLVHGHDYLFAIQAIDSCGRMTEAFTHAYNARQFISLTIYPELSVMGVRLGSGSFKGTYQRPAPIHVPPGVPLKFFWEASNAFPWSGPIEYRYGWDVQSLDDDDDWFYVWSPSIRQSNERKQYAGVHVFYIEARDNAGTTTRARIEIEVIPFPMDRDLLWIDDFRLTESPVPSRIYPTEGQHDKFWTEICSRAPGFDPMIDILPADDLYATGLYADTPLPLEALSRHKHIIWTYGNSLYDTWKRTVQFVPDPELFPFTVWPYQTPVFKPNTLALYLAAGGSALTCGRGDNNYDALAATFPLAPLMPASILEHTSGGPAGNYAGIYSMAFNDYYITVIDKVSGMFTDDLPEGIVRRIEWEAMRYAYTQDADPLLPDTLTLSEYVTAPGMFWDPATRGFSLVEVYDPEYYMEYRSLHSQDCFTPLYRMRAVSTLSPLDHTAMALRTTLRECEVDRYPPYESFHFGLPLWYIEQDQVEQIADYIFQRWSIR